MFGYVTAYKPELKIKDYEAYKGVYCTLCKEMGKEYGLLSRFLLSYDGAFYVLTYGLSNKMRQIEHNPTVAISGDWFTAHGKGVNLGYFGKAENALIAKKMKSAFSEWIDNGHNNFDDVNTCILCIELTDGLLLSHGTRYEIDFSK